MSDPLGYGRYADSPNWVGCPRARTDMTPCAARDGRLAEQEGACVGCGVNVADCLAELVRHITEPKS